MKNRISWAKALGIGIEIAPKGKRGSQYDMAAIQN